MPVCLPVEVVSLTGAGGEESCPALTGVCEPPVLRETPVLPEVLVVGARLGMGLCEAEVQDGDDDVAVDPGSGDVGVEVAPRCPSGL